MCGVARALAAHLPVDTASRAHLHILHALLFYVAQASGEMGEITGLFMVDDEGTLTTTDVKAKFVNGKPQAIEAKFNMRSQFEWDRFMRFMDRYAEDAGLGFEKK